VLVVIDTERADHLPCYGYARDTAPSTCALERDGILFERAYAPRTSTTPAIASMLTGLYPHRHGVQSLYLVLPKEIPTLATHLAAAGYGTGAFVSSYVMVADFSGLETGFEVYDDAVQDREPFRENYERPAKATTDRAIGWLSMHGPRAFVFVHLIEPHGPYTPPSPYLERFALPHAGERVDPAQVPPYQLIPGADFVNDYVGRYDGEIATADAQVGRLVEWLRDHGWYDRATIVVVADHGESMGEGGRWFKHGGSVDEAQSHVPLILKLRAGQRAALRGARIAAPVSTVDVFSTVLAAAGVAAPSDAAFTADLAEIAAGEVERMPPVVTELRKPDALTISARSPACEVTWTFAGAADLTMPGEATDVALHANGGWPHLVKQRERLPATASDGCEAELTAAASPLVLDVLTFKQPYQVVSRKDLKDPGMRDRFVAERSSRVIPLRENEEKALRSLGYVE